MSDNIDFAALAEPVARALLGQPNPKMSTRHELRFGNNGSVALKIDGERRGQWFDHEANIGGGTLDLIRHKAGVADGAAIAWLRDNRFIAAQPETPRPRIVATYDYRDASGGLLFQVCRFDPKTFRQRRPDGGGGWIWKMDGVDRVPYRLPELTAADPAAPVFIVEGEKDADRLATLGLIATTNPGGAGKWQDAYSTPLRDRDAVILPDNDDAGEAHAEKVARHLTGIARSIRILRLPGLPAKGDVSDWIAAGGTAEELLGLATTAPLHGEPAPYDGCSGAPEDAAPEPKPAAETADRPLIQVKAGQLDVLADAGELALLRAQADVFQRADYLVRPGFSEVPAADDRTTIAAGLHVIAPPALREELSRVAHWQKFDGRSKCWQTIDPPALVASVLGARKGRWHLRPCLGVVTAPTLRPDCSILAAPGYDSATRLFHMPEPNLVVPPVPDNPTRTDAEAALDLLVGLIAEFPFVTPIDRAVALSLMVSTVARGALGMVPVHAFTAPAPGSGKSYLADVTTAIVSGRLCPVISAGKTEEELEKRLGAMLLAGYLVISIDNVSSGLSGDALCQIAERPTIRIRILGKSETPECEFRGIIIANGNNLIIVGDMTRRVLLGKLDAGVERPECRTFTFDPVQRVLADRGSYIAAAMTIVKAYAAAGQPGKLPPLASYGAWSDRVRSALVWLGCGDPVATMDEARATDPVLTTLRTALHAWRNAFGDQALTCTKVAAKFSGYDPDTTEGEALTALRSALPATAKTVKGGIDENKLGYWLRKYKGRPCGGLKFVNESAHGGVAAWRVVSVNDPTI